MFWDKKENKNGLPELPPLKFSNLPPEESNEDTESQPLPSFPDSPMKKGFSQSTIKESMETEDEELPELPTKFRVPRIKELDEIPSNPMTFEAKSAKTEDVYVKIDRFHSARKALNTARDKLKEIDELMRKIRETKMREEQELSSWEKEIETIKSKVEDVTNNIFEKVE
jgi:chromosome segregation ATPase